MKLSPTIAPFRCFIPLNTKTVFDFPISGRVNRGYTLSKNMLFNTLNLPLFSKYSYATFSRIILSMTAPSLFHHPRIQIIRPSKYTNHLCLSFNPIFPIAIFVSQLTLFLFIFFVVLCSSYVFYE